MKMTAPAGTSVSYFYGWRKVSIGEVDVALNDAGFNTIGD
jgi:hypothetical protein